MADYQIHLRQAEHNKSLLDRLNRRLEFRDWSITVAFYAAIHYVEIGFFNIPDIQHSETSKPQRRSYHDWRQELIANYFPVALNSYQRLRSMSRTARYLTAGGQAPLLQTAHDYFSTIFPSNQDFKEFINNNLQTIRTAVGP